MGKKSHDGRIRKPNWYLTMGWGAAVRSSLGHSLISENSIGSFSSPRPYPFVDSHLVRMFRISLMNSTSDE